MSYITLSDLCGENRYFESFGENLYGTNGTLGTAGSVILLADIDSGFDVINDELRAMGRFSAIPLQLDENGEYPQTVVDANAYWVISNKLMSRFQAEFENIPPSILYFGSQYDKCMKRISDGCLIFDDENSTGEIGIGKPVNQIIGTDSRGTFFNNWEGYPFEENTYSYDPRHESFGVRQSQQVGFAGADFPRTWAVEIDSDGGIGTCTFKWSMNAGKDWEEEGVVTDEEWTYLYDNVFVRFAPDNAGSHYFTTGDKWTFRTIPEEIRRTYGENEVHKVEGGRSF